jgi:endonuclease/exonuclease/phosphatase family metal-dependent hydrolase
VEALAGVIQRCAPDVVVLQEATRPEVVARLAEATAMPRWAAAESHSVGFMSRLPLRHR